MSHTSRYWPRRAAGLPPGQRELTRHPRFGALPQRPPPDPAPVRLEVRIEGAVAGVLDLADLQALGEREVVADLHCVTTWSVRDLRWTGVPAQAVLRSVLGDGPPPAWVVARGGDRLRTSLCWADITGPDVLVAWALHGRPLSVDHGAPLRLVVPGHYGYKSVKHLVALDGVAVPPAPQLGGRDHPRARVALEERHGRVPGRLLRWPYRLLVPPTIVVADRTVRRWEARR